MPTSVTAPQRGAYRAHRDRQRRRILDAASKLIDDRGIDRATMAEIVAASGIRASTLYQYFPNKEEIVWAILEEAIADATARAKRAMQPAKTALDKIAALLDLMAGDLAAGSPTVRLLAQFDAIYARDWPAERLLTIEAQINPGGFLAFATLIRQGIADGSLRPDLDPDLTMHAVMNAVIGAQRRLASLGSRVELEYGQTVDKLFRETIRVILLGLRAETNNRQSSARPTRKQTGGPRRLS
jgi:AcrR family transcriptional regulator